MACITPPLLLSLLLSLLLPAASADDAPEMRVSLSWTAAADLDLGLVAPSGAAVGLEGGDGWTHSGDVVDGSRPEVLAASALVGGDYIVRVTNFSPRPVAYTVTTAAGRTTRTTVATALPYRTDTQASFQLTKTLSPTGQQAVLMVQAGPSASAAGQPRG